LFKSNHEHRRNKDLMDKHNIDFLEKINDEGDEAFEQFSKTNWRKFFALGRIGGLIIAIIIIVGLSYTTKAVISSNNVAEQFGNTSVFEQIKHLVGANDKLLTGEEQDRINVLILGIGGEEHEGGQLTDTIMIASIEPSTQKIGLLSIPRDLVVPIPYAGWQKINSAHAYATAWYPDELGAGPNLTKETVQNITGIDIHYYVKLDFSGFVKIINALGGIRVDVKEEFTDNQYPDNNYGYEPVHFDSGWQNLDGDSALKYVRSRHASNNEGTDFARAKRQQDIIQALQARTLALSTLLNPNKILTLADIIGKHLETDMEIWESFKVLDLVKQANSENITQIVLSTGENGLLIPDTSEEGAYILRPRIGHGDFAEISLVTQHLLDDNPLNILDKKEIIQTNSTKLSIRNGTLHEGLATRTAQVLRNLSYKIVEIGNSEQRGFEKTVIYIISDEDLKEDIQILKQELNANIAPIIPNNIDLPDADLLIIVGEDSV
jgi:polyisoprenyl-teichoic acid--peptidoglycan teichoic acid transferase